MADRLFISHASEDAAVAERIVAYLEARGMPCWISSRDIPPRAIYADTIVEGMQACNACAVLVSAASNTSKPVKREVELASHEDKDFIPIRIDGAEPAAGLAYYLRNSQWVDYRREGERALDRVVGSFVGGSSPSPYFNHSRNPAKPTPFDIVGSWQSDGMRVTFKADHTCISELLDGDGTPCQRGDWPIVSLWQAEGDWVTWTPRPLGADASGLAEKMHQQLHAYKGRINGSHIDAWLLHPPSSSFLGKHALSLSADSPLPTWFESGDRSIRLMRVR